MLDRFHSAVIEVGDFSAAVEHYAALLGREPAWIGRNTERGARIARFRLANMALEIRDPGKASADETREGLRGIRFGPDPGDALDASGSPGDLTKWLTERGVASFAGTREIEEEAQGAQHREWTRIELDPASSRGLGIELAIDAADAAPLDSRPSVATEAAIADLDHVVVLSADAEATRDFFLEGLDLRLALDKTFEERKVRLLFFRVGGVTVEIGSRLGAKPEPGSIDRFGGLAWEVGNADAIRERLAGEGFDVSEVRAGHKPGTRVCTVRDQVHGVPTLLIEPVSR